MPQVNPNETVRLVYLFTDMTDVTVYYVQAKVRDSVSGTVLKIVNLTRDSVNTRRFTGSFTAPGFNGASAYYIDVTTTPYLDSGYSSQATNYPEQVQQYQVLQRWSQALNGGGSGDPFAQSTNKKLVATLRKLFEEYVASQPEQDRGDLNDSKDEILTTLRAELRGHAVKINKAVNTTVAKAMEQIRMEALGARLSTMQIDEPEVAAEAPAEDPMTGERTLNEALAAPEKIQGKRGPSAGVVPIHVKARNMARFSPKKPL